MLIAALFIIATSGNNSNTHHQWVYKQNVVCVQSNVCTLSHFSRVWLFATLWIVAHQAPLSVGFSRQEYCSGLSCPPPGDLPNPRTEPVAPALQADSLPLSHGGSPQWNITGQKKKKKGMKCWYTLQHEWTFRTLYYMKEGSHKWPHIVGVHLY